MDDGISLGAVGHATLLVVQYGHTPRSSNRAMFGRTDVAAVSQCEKRIGVAFRLHSNPAPTIISLPARALFMFSGH